MYDDEKYTFEVDGYTIDMSAPVKFRIDALKRVHALGQKEAGLAGVTPEKFAEQVMILENEIIDAVENCFDTDTAEHIKSVVREEVVFKLNDFLHNRVTGSFPLDLFS